MLNSSLRQGSEALAVMSFVNIETQNEPIQCIYMHSNQFLYEALKICQSQVLSKPCLLLHDNSEHNLSTIKEPPNFTSDNRTIDVVSGIMYP